MVVSVLASRHAVSNRQNNEKGAPGCLSLAWLSRTKRRVSVDTLSELQVRTLFWQLTALWQLTAPVRGRTYLARPHPPRRARLRWLSLWAAALPRTDCARLYWNPRRSSALARPCSSAAFVTQARRSRHSGPPPSNLASRAALARADRARPHWPVLARRLPAAFAHSALARRARPLRSIPPRSIPPRSGPLRAPRSWPAALARAYHARPHCPVLAHPPRPPAALARSALARRASPLRFGPPRSRAPLWPTALALCPPGPTLTSPARCAESSPAQTHRHSGGGGRSADASAPRRSARRACCGRVYRFARSHFILVGWLFCTALPSHVRVRAEVTSATLPC